MSVNVRWNGRGWPGKVPRSPVAPHEGRRDRQKKKRNWKKEKPPTEKVP
jgi:hypothetical protein